MNILITGHTGFVGKALVNYLSNHNLNLAGRRRLDQQLGSFFKKELNSNEDYSDCLAGVDVVIHAAARVHLMSDFSTDPLACYREVNYFGTLNLAKQAAASGVKRFIFISTIKVNGETTSPGQLFTSFDVPNAIDPYGVSKLEAEHSVKEICLSSGMEFVIIRPPLVYGPGVKSNFSALLRLAKKNLPLPLGSINNLRSMVALENLVDLINKCIDHPKAANQIFLVSDDRDVSTTELLKLMIQFYGKTPRLFRVPMSIIIFIGKLIGKADFVSRLCGNLQIDISHTKNVLDWRPPVTVEYAIKSTIFGRENVD